MEVFQSIGDVSMRVKLTITDGDGNRYAGEMELSPIVPENNSKRLKIGATTNPRSQDLDFELPLRPFIKKYSQSMSGPKRLTLLVAWLAKGNAEERVERAEVAKAWDKMKALMGGAFNSAYETRAKDSGWVHSPKAGVYTLLPNWRDVV
jgi:hypothetical protein